MEVVEEVEDEYAEISLEEARNYVDDVEVGEELVIDVTPEDFGRIAAQSAKQVITQRIREAEREMIFDKYKNRTGDLVAGAVQRYERGNVIVDLGNAEALLPSREHPPGERYRYGERLKAIIIDIQKSSKDAQIILSRNDPSLVVKLFEQEVAEIRDGIVNIRLVAREPGNRSKIAVLSSDSDVDPVGACVGMKGSRVQMVVQELRGERIDIIEYSDDKRRFVANSLKPANIESVEYDPQSRRALLVVRDDELALAIGKSGLNARLASELTGVNIDIISESQLAERERLAKQELSMIPSVKAGWTDAFLAKGIIKAGDILEAGLDGLTSIEGLDPETAQIILDETEQFLQERENLKQESTEESESNGISEENVIEIEQENGAPGQDLPDRVDNAASNSGSNPEQEASASL
ncbi:MAG: transcription termination factor NusA, partial [Candidatus Hinthialibacter sp.]